MKKNFRKNNSYFNNKGFLIGSKRKSYHEFCQNKTSTEIDWNLTKNFKTQVFSDYPQEFLKS
jgi:hypothetical protein